MTSWPFRWTYPAQAVFTAQLWSSQTSEPWSGRCSWPTSPTLTTTTALFIVATCVKSHDQYTHTEPGAQPLSTAMVVTLWERLVDHVVLRLADTTAVADPAEASLCRWFRQAWNGIKRDNALCYGALNANYIEDLLQNRLCNCVCGAAFLRNLVREVRPDVIGQYVYQHDHVAWCVQRQHQWYLIETTNEDEHCELLDQQDFMTEPPPQSDQTWAASFQQQSQEQHRWLLGAPGALAEQLQELWHWLNVLTNPILTDPAELVRVQRLAPSLLTALAPMPSSLVKPYFLAALRVLAAPSPAWVAEQATETAQQVLTDWLQHYETLLLHIQTHPDWSGLFRWHAANDLTQHTVNILKWQRWPLPQVLQFQQQLRALQPGQAWPVLVLPHLGP